MVYIYKTFHLFHFRNVYIYSFGKIEYVIRYNQKNHFFSVLTVNLIILTNRA